MEKVLVAQVAEVVECCGERMLLVAQGTVVWVEPGESVLPVEPMRRVVLVGV